MAAVSTGVIPEGACVAVRKRGTTPFWLNAIIKKGSDPFFGMPQAKRRSGLAAALAAVAMLIGTAKMVPHAQAAMPRRIVSLVPATTEMLFAMGAGDKVAGKIGRASCRERV